MTKTLFATAALLLVTAAPAFADEKPAEISFQRDGETYVYTKAELPGRVVLTGHRFPAGDSFELTVRGNRVTGTIGETAVFFKMPRARAKAGAGAEVAAR
ncbi:MAG: hypothetical protein WC804_08335 [Sphingomonas sp.]|jgi:hypothetical protein|uniref:hypothetical protein n=1 Tax=Sphingomonas sp. TaxID=28214 RepID=UPI003565685B